MGKKWGLGTIILCFIANFAPEKDTFLLPFLLLGDVVEYEYTRFKRIDYFNQDQPIIIIISCILKQS